LDRDNEPGKSGGIWSCNRPNEIYGLGIVSVDSEQGVKDLIANDPAAKINKYEYFPIQAIVPVK
jgi:hypothetical protein